MNNITIYLIDDEEDIRDSTEQSLMLAGYTVETFSAAKPALAKITPEFNGAIISDICMPVMGGDGVNA